MSKRRELFALLEVTSKQNAELIINSFKTGIIGHIDNKMYILGDENEKKEYEKQMKIYKEAKERTGWGH